MDEIHGKPEAGETSPPSAKRSPAPPAAPGGGSKRRPRTGRRPGGRLKIGDEWMAIQIIARSQTNPQKAVAELVENAIDAGAKRIVITRARKERRVYLRVSDDGRGVPLSPEGAPDFDYVATHICDSLKRRLGERQRAGVQGEFGIGLLGFWAIGRELEMVSQTGDAPAYMMTMRSGSRSYDRRRYLGSRGGSGVDVTIHDVHREVQSRLTAEKLQRYLGEELRERIRRAGVTVVLEDRLPPRRTLEVRPAVFRGERIREIGEIPVRDRAPIRAELYLAPEPARPGGGDDGAAAGAGANEAWRPAVALYRLGTRVGPDIALLPEFAREPWTSGRLEGSIDYADFRLAPASREGFLPDAAYHAFVEALRRVEPMLEERLRREDEARAERVSRSLVRDLPSGEYDWFGRREGRPFAADGSGRPGGTGAVPRADPAVEAAGGPGAGAAGADAAADGAEAGPGTSDPASASAAAETEDAEALPAQPALVTGPLDRVILRPATVRVVAGGRKRARAVALDASGLVINGSAMGGIEFTWSITPGIAGLAVEPGGTAMVEAGPRPARGTLTVEARDHRRREEPIERSAAAEVLVESEAARSGFPPPHLVHAQGESWRSRWNAGDGRLEVNSAHPDYQAVPGEAARRRYFGRLYAKELVLHNFGHEPAPAVLERMLEVLTRLDGHL
jgi:hypothetical protein